jgi:hypothetical protein
MRLTMLRAGRYQGAGKLRYSESKHDSLRHI